MIINESNILINRKSFDRSEVANRSVARFSILACHFFVNGKNICFLPFIRKYHFQYKVLNIIGIGLVIDTMQALIMQMLIVSWSCFTLLFLKICCRDLINKIFSTKLHNYLVKSYDYNYQSYGKKFTDSCILHECT